MLSRVCRAVACLVSVLAAQCGPAGASWLHCAASGTNGAGAFVYYTTLADVGPVKPPRLDQLQRRLLAYVVKADPDARGTKAQCYTFDDQLLANEHYSRMLNASAESLGWDHVVVVKPQDWLAATDIVDDPMQP